MVFAGEGEGLRKPFREYGAETDHLMQARELFWLLREFDDLGSAGPSMSAVRPPMVWDWQSTTA